MPTIRVTAQGNDDDTSPTALEVRMQCLSELGYGPLALAFSVGHDKPTDLVEELAMLRASRRLLAIDRALKVASQVYEWQ